jgi:hypothetical protein
MQPPRDRGADATRSAGDESGFAGERLGHEGLRF